ncbi:hypothetical protein F183_A44390 [Bryobacterales bacterium F-183]|nr:hypothetical protein F183_A44390 [Bryobacterales bacterium F-183]
MRRSALVIGLVALTGVGTAYTYSSRLEQQRLSLPLAEAGCEFSAVLDRSVTGFAGEFVDRNRDGKLDCVTTGAGSHVYIVDTAEQAERAFRVYYDAAFASGVFRETCPDGTVDNGKVVRTAEGWLTVEHCGVAKGLMSSLYRSPIGKSSWPQWYARDSVAGREWQQMYDLARRQAGE